MCHPQQGLLPFLLALIPPLGMLVFGVVAFAQVYSDIASLRTVGMVAGALTLAPMVVLAAVWGARVER
jgi:hypothetical protein